LQGDLKLCNRTIQNRLLLCTSVQGDGPDLPEERAQALFAGIMRILLKGLILAQNERWRRGLGMQVERIPWGQLCGGSGERGSKAWATCPGAWDSHPNGWVNPDALFWWHHRSRKVYTPGEAHVVLASWWGNGPPRPRCLAGVRARPAPLALRHWPDSYGRLQSRIFGNGRKPDRATPRVR
jgi:hypothetical protein